MTSATVLHGDCLTVLRDLDANSMDAIVTDPPYELGFMGKSWDSSGIAYSVPMWSECLRVLKPGGYLLSFGGTRTYHRMACAVQDAGFEIRDSITWLYGSGFPKGKAQLKPASEPIVVARKPAPGPWLNIDGCRVATDEVITNHARGAGSAVSKGIYGDSSAQATHQTAGQAAGRWPSNVVFTHGETCVDGGVCVVGCPVADLDQQSGTLKSGLFKPEHADHGKVAGTLGAMAGRERTTATYGDTGGASRFFPVFRYQAKAPSRERPEVGGVKHPTVKPLALMQWLVRLVTPPGGTVLDPFAGSGTTVEAALVEGFQPVGIERDPHYLPLIQQRIDRVHAARAAHDTAAADQVGLFDIPA